MAEEKVLELADGRTWVGQQAVDVGLVDGIGTLDGIVGQVASGNGAAGPSRSLAAVAAAITAPAEDQPMDPNTKAGAGSAPAPHGTVYTGSGANVVPAPAMTLESLRTNHADLAATLVAEGHKKGVAEERARIAKLFKACPDAHRETFGGMIESGCSVEDGLMGFLADQRRLKDSRLERIERAGGKPLGADTDRAETISEPQFANDDERYKAEFERLGGDVDGQRRNAVEIRQEFGELKYYVAYQKGRSAGHLRGGR